MRFKVLSFALLALFSSSWSQSDTGKTWTAQNSGVTVTLHSVRFLGRDTGYVTGTGRILKTVNGGATWTSRLSGGSSTGYFNALRFATRDVGYAVGSTVVKTTNGGTNWSALSIPSFAALRDISFPDPALGFAVGISGAIWRVKRPGYVVGPTALKPALPATGARAFKGLKRQGAGMAVSSEGRSFDTRGRNLHPTAVKAVEAKDLRAKE